MGKVAVYDPLSFIVLCLLVATTGASNIFRTSHVPVTVGLNKHHSGPSATRSTGRTKSLFFERVLGLVRNEPFSLDMDKWHSLVGCGLFRNLTARTAVGPDGGVTLHVTGQELPSSSFTPEISVIASLEDPEIVGGVKWTDNNFRGMGERIAFSVTKKEGLEGTSISLYPDVSLHWSDNTIGSASRVSLSNAQEHSFRSCADLINRRSRLAANNMDNAEWFSRRMPVRTSVSSAKFEHLVPSKQLRNSWLGRVVRSLSYSVEPFARTHHLQLSGNELSNTAIGGTHRIDFSMIGGTLLKAWHEAGTHITRGGLSLPAWNSHKQNDPFNQAGIHVDFPSLSLSCGTVPRGPRFTLPFLGRSANITVPSVVEPRDRTVFLSGKLKLQAMKSWGSGCVPMHHETSLASPSVLRGLTPSARGPSDDAVSGFAAAKVDVYLKGLLPAATSLGMFLDAGVHAVADATSLSAVSKANERSSAGNALARYQGIATVGMSLRMLGFRVDYGLPVSLDRPAQVHFSLDRGD